MNYYLEINASQFLPIRRVSSTEGVWDQLREIFLPSYCNNLLLLFLWSSHLFLNIPKKLPNASMPFQWLSLHYGIERRFCPSHVYYHWNLKTFCLGLVIDELKFNSMVDTTKTKLPEKKKKRKNNLKLKIYLILFNTEIDENWRTH